MALDYAATPDVRTRLDDGVLWVIVHRPEKRNALAVGVLERLRELFVAHAEDPSIRCAVLRGAGDKAFASGGDVVELAAVRTAAEAREMSEHGKRALDAVRRFPVPVVAAVNGLALGGGAELALACDLRFAAAHARIGLIHAQLAIAPSWGGGVDLMRLVGPAKGLKLLATCRQLAAEEAKALGLVDAIAPAEADFEAALLQFLDATFRSPPQVMRAIKSLALGERMAGREALDAAETERFVEAWIHDDHWAAVEARSRKPGPG
jgi:enoyl-CoA hydratase